jgi:putative cofactor-binding repeat protein
MAHIDRLTPAKTNLVRGMGGYARVATLGTKGADGSNVLPTDVAIAAAVNDTTPSATRTALNNLYGFFVNVKSFGATGDGTTDDTAAIQAAETALGGTGRDLHFPAGTYRITSAITKTSNVSWRGEGAAFSQGVSGNYSSRILVDGPTSGYAVTVNTVSNVGVSGIEFTTSVTSRDLAGCLYINGASPGYSRVERCAFDNFATGVKVGTSGNWVVGNVFNSCGVPIDVSGSENHVIGNHGYGDGATAAILVRTSANMVIGNKFFGDGASTNYGLVVWGYGNTVQGNVYDAFNEARIDLEGHNTAPFNAGNPDCTANTVVGNNVSGCGNLGNVAGLGGAGTYNAGVMLRGVNGDVTVIVLIGNTVFNKRTDRATDSAIYLRAESGRTVSGTVVQGNVLRNATNGVRRAGTTTGTKYRDNIGYVTENSGTASGYNGLTVAHGLAITPSEIVTTVDANNIYMGASVDATNITLKMRDSAGVLVPSGSPVTVRWAARA